MSHCFVRVSLTSKALFRVKLGWMRQWCLKLCEIQFRSACDLNRFCSMNFHGIRNTNSQMHCHFMPTSFTNISIIRIKGITYGTHNIINTFMHGHWDFINQLINTNIEAFRFVFGGWVEAHLIIKIRQTEIFLHYPWQRMWEKKSFLPVIYPS